jgi:hypothetical protein
MVKKTVQKVGPPAGLLVLIIEVVRYILAHI